MAYLKRAVGQFLVKNPVKNSIIQVASKKYEADHMTNITPNVLSLLEKKNHLVPNHPINMVRQKVYNYFKRNHVDKNGKPLFATFDDFSPVTTPAQNFDNCLIPEGHKDRSEDENIFINQHTMLRCHTFAHVVDLLQKGFSNFLITGDVYRLDDYDHTHSCIFHQMEWLKLFTKEELVPGQEIFDGSVSRTSALDTEQRQLVHTEEAVTAAMSNMKKIAEEVVIGELFGNNVKFRWTDIYMLFFRPAMDMEVFYDGKWLEVLSGGILKQEILDNAGVTDKINWNLGIGLDRIAMILYNIPDIRLLSSSDGSQAPGTYSSAARSSGYREITFWIPPSARSYNFERNFYQYLRMVAGDVVDKVKLIDHYQHPQTKQVQHRYRITYRNWEKPMSEEDINMWHDSIKILAKNDLDIKLEP